MKTTKDERDALRQQIGNDLLRPSLLAALDDADRAEELEAELEDVRTALKICDMRAYGAERDHGEALAEVSRLTAENRAMEKVARDLRTAIQAAWKVTQQHPCTLDPLGGVKCLSCQAGEIFGDALRASFDVLGEDIAAAKGTP